MIQNRSNTDVVSSTYTTEHSIGTVYAASNVRDMRHHRPPYWCTRCLRERRTASTDTRSAAFDLLEEQIDVGQSRIGLGA
jgi:hypothetical protein